MSERCYITDDGERFFIEDDDVVLNELPNEQQCAALVAQFNRDNFFPNVWHVNERGNVDLLSIDANSYRIVGGWV